MTSSRAITAAWVAFVIVALLLLDAAEAIVYAVVVTAAAAALAGITLRHATGVSGTVDRRDLWWASGFYLGVVVLFRLAFEVFTPERTAPMFLSFAAGLLLGTVGPIVYSTWLRGRSLGDLGLALGDRRRTIALALVFAGVQFAITLWGHALPAPVDWVPLLVMSLTVGAFEAIFFRGFLQARLEASFGLVPGVAGASVLYALYHVGFGMGMREIVFLFGLGLVYTVAYRLTGSVFVLWPLLTPLGSFYAQLESGDLAGSLPWASIAGFVDVLALMGVAIWLAARHLRRRAARAEPPSAGRLRLDRSVSLHL